MTSPRTPAFDGLRALAAIAVVAHHTLWRDTSTLGRVLVILEPGHAGVRLFFVLSGFLITGILLRARSAPVPAALKSFYVRRALRIVPLYYVFLGGMALLDATTRETLPWHLGYATNVMIALAGKFPPPPLTHLWSLAVEEQFYLLWPLLVLLLPPRRLFVVLLAMTLLGPLSRALVYLATASAVSADMWMPSCLDTLGAGALLAWLVHHRDARLRLLAPALLLGTSLVAITRVLAITHTLPLVRLILGDFGYALVFTAVVARCARGVAWLSWRPLRYLGEISYGIYLLHLGVPVVLGALGLLQWLGEPGLRQFFLTLALTVAAAALCYELIERPFLRLKDCFALTARASSLHRDAAPTLPRPKATPSSP